ncbi:hypothetical protein ACPUBH_003391 [Vibrio cholerae]
MTPLLEQFALVVGGQYREAYLALLRISVIAIARFGLFRSPDPAVFLSSYFYSK